MSAVVRRATAGDVAVHPEQGGKGIGAALIWAVIDHLKAEGARRLDLAPHVGMPQNVVRCTRLRRVETGRADTRVFMSRAL